MQSIGQRLVIAQRGLSENEANYRLKKFGYNELPRPDRRTWVRIVIEVLREPMLALLLGSGLIYLAIGELNDALLLVAFAMLSIVITVVQETRTEHVLEALRDLTSPRALVVRDGYARRIAGRDVVTGDIIIVSEGDRVPADAALLQSNDLQVDESLLTGESVPVRKAHTAATPAIKLQRPGGDDLPFVFSGSLVVRGEGIAEVLATGPQSQIGHIGQTLRAMETETPRLQAQVRRAVRVFAIVGATVSIIAALLHGTFRGNWLDALLAGIALGMSMIPEEFPVVLTVFMAMGAWRISRSRVLTRRATAIESLGSATVLCTDKTGTLTENRMSVAELRLKDGQAFRPAGAHGAMDEPFRFLLQSAVRASAPQPFDPMEKALRDLNRLHENFEETGWKLVHTHGLRPDLLAMTQVWQAEEGSANFIVVTKGAPEAIGQLCRLNDSGRTQLKTNVEEMTANGLRVLAVARGSFSGSGEDLPQTPREYAFDLIGLVGLADPLRLSVPDAVKQCRSAGIRVVMITGDYPTTAAAIAMQAGIQVDDVLTGEMLNSLTDEELAEQAATTSVFARVLPEQKLRIVKAFKSGGEIVAMTGDGVNDAPSLKAAHIGIAMGGRGTDVAREASSIVLLDDDFSSIVKAIRLGRRIYDNLLKAMGFILAAHVPIAGLALLPLVFGLPVLLMPVHIALLELIIDPVSSLVFEAEQDEKNVMDRPPRAADEPLFSWALTNWSIVQGSLAFGLVAAIFVIGLDRGMPENEVRALAFFSLVSSIFGLVLVNRTFSSSLLSALKRKNMALAWVLTAILLIMAGVLGWPFASNLFRFGPLHVDDLALTLAAGGAVLVMLEVLKPSLAPVKLWHSQKSLQ